MTSLLSVHFRVETLYLKEIKKKKKKRFKVLTFSQTLQFVPLLISCDFFGCVVPQNVLITDT